MAFKRLLIEFGQGVDMHGGDQNNAILKATEDAVHHCCMAGLFEIFQMEDIGKEARLHADVYVPHPEDAAASVVIDCLSKWGWTGDAEVHQGGANPRGIALGSDPETEITIAIVVLTVYVDV